MTSASGTADVESAAVDATTADDENEDETCMMLCLCVCYVAELGLSLLAFISVLVAGKEGCDHLPSSTYIYFGSVAGSLLFLGLVWYISCALVMKCKCRFLCCDIVELIWLVLFIILYLMASIKIAKHTCGRGWYKAAAAFGFLCSFMLIMHAVCVVGIIVEKIRGDRSQQTTTKTTDNEVEKY